MRHQFIRHFCQQLLLLVVTCGLVHADLYVSPRGDDSSPGTNARPLRSIRKARDAVRRELAQTGMPVRPLTVWLAAGTYILDDTLKFTAADSGTDANPVVYRAVAGQEVRLIGGRRIPPDSFKGVRDESILNRLDAAARSMVVQTELKPLGVNDLGQVPPGGRRLEVFFNDRRLTLARWPNAGFAKIVDVVGGEPMTVHGLAGNRIGKFTYEGNRPDRWTKETDVWLHGYWFWDWSDEYQKVESIETRKRTISLIPPHHRYGYRKGMRYYAVNLLAELDAPGEWYLDRETSILYVWPPEPIEEANVVVSILENPLIMLDGASNIVLRGLTMEATRGTGVQVTEGKNTLIAGCTIRNTGGAAVVIRGGKNHRVVGCDIYQTGSAGISISGGDRRTLMPAGHLAANNHIHHFARLKRTYAAAIHLDGVGNRAAHNLIHDAPHMAIGFGGNDNVMELNEIHDVCQETGDVGVFYTGRDWTVRGNVIRHNFIHHVSGPGLHGAQGVYLDDCASGTIVVGNVIYKTARAMLIGGGRDNLIENNLILNCRESIRFDNRGLGWMSYHVAPDGIMPERLQAMPYKQPPWSERYPQLLSLLDNQPGAPKCNIIRHNVLHASGPMRLAKEVVEFGTIVDNPTIDEDPGFRNAAEMDFRLSVDSVLLKKLPEFRPIPFEEIGLLQDEYRTKLPNGE